MSRTLGEEAHVPQGCGCEGCPCGAHLLQVPLKNLLNELIHHLHQVLGEQEVRQRVRPYLGNVRTTWGTMKLPQQDLLLSKFWSFGAGEGGCCSLTMAAQTST